MISVALGFLLTALVHLGPETPVGTRASGAAASPQSSPAVAWNGHTGLVVWVDERGNYPAERFPRSPAAPMLRVSPVRADGSLVNAEGTPLFPANAARLASNGTSFMLAYAERSGVYTVPLNESGAPDGVTTRMTDDWLSFDIVSNHHTFLFAGKLATNEIRTVVLQPSGIPSAAKNFSSSGYEPIPASVTTIGDVYALAYRTTSCPPCDTKVHLALLAENAATTDALVADMTDMVGPMMLAASDDRLLLSLVTPAGIQTLTVGRDLNVLTPLHTIVTPVNFTEPGPVLWDGQSFLVTWAQVTANPDDIAWEAIRVSPGNVALDTAPAVIARNRPLELTLTRTSDRIVAMWSSLSDVLRGTFVSNAALFVQPPAAIAEVFSLHAQSEASHASVGGEPLRVWREGSLDVHVMLSIGDKTIDVASSTDRDLHDPSVAAGDDVILVLWRDLPRSLFTNQLSVPGQRIRARRFALDGTPLDPQPLALDGNDCDYVEINLGTATVFDGRNFVAIWSGNRYAENGSQPSVRARRISPAGVSIDSAPFFITAATDYGFSTGLRAVSTASEVLVAWSSWEDYRFTLISPRPTPRTAIQVVRLDTRGSSMNVIDARDVWRDAGIGKEIGLAWNGTNAVVASLHRSCVEVTMLDASLNTIHDVIPVECGPIYSGAIEHLGAAWNGSEFVVAWAADAVHIMRFDRALNPLDAAPFEIAPAGVASHEPSLAASPSGVEITYERIDGEVPRLFTRELDRLGVTPRGRPVR